MIFSQRRQNKSPASNASAKQKNLTADADIWKMQISADISALAIYWATTNTNARLALAWPYALCNHARVT